MKKMSVIVTAISLLSSLSFAKVIAKTEVICVENPSQETVRTIYMMDNNSVLLADPVGLLMTADSVQQPSNDTVVIGSATVDGQEFLQIKNDGSGALAVQNSAGTKNIKMNCFSPNAQGNIELPKALVK